MSFSSVLIVDRIASHAQASGLFKSVNGHEPKSAPEGDLTAAVWSDAVVPAVAASGLNSTSALLTFKMRLYTPMLTEPQDLIDPTLTNARDVVLTALTADLSLGGTIKSIDALGSHGTPLSATAGYVEIGGAMFRVIDITIPCVVNDAYPQGA